MQWSVIFFATTLAVACLLCSTEALPNPHALPEPEPQVGAVIKEVVKQVGKLVGSGSKGSNPAKTAPKPRPPPPPPAPAPAPQKEEEKD